MPLQFVGMAPAGAQSAPETLVPKGGEPQQLTADQAAGWALFDEMQKHQDKVKAAGKLGSFRNAAASAAKEAAGGILATPSLAADLVSYFPRLAMSGGPSSGQEPPPLTGVTPRLTPEKVYGGLKGAQALLQGQNPVTAYQQGVQSKTEDEAAREEANPISSMVGTGLGDVALLTGGRLPIAKKVVEATKPFVERELGGRIAAAGMPAGPARTWTRFVKSPAWTSLARAGVKAGETGLEAGMMSALQGGDPAEAAGIAGAGQLSGSVMMSMIHHPVYSTGALMGLTMLNLYLQRANPFNAHDYVTHAVEDAADHLYKGTVLGLGAAVLGAGRFRGAKYGGKFAQEFPKLAEGINAVMRGSTNATIVSMLQKDATSDKPVIGPVLNKLAEDASVFKPAELTRLSNAALKGNLSDTVQSMVKNKDFATRMGL